MSSLLPDNLEIAEGLLFSQYNPDHRPGHKASASLSLLGELSGLIGDFQFKLRGESLMTEIAANDVSLKVGYLILIPITPEMLVFLMNGTSTQWVSLKSLIEKDTASIRSADSVDVLPSEEQDALRAAFLDSWPSKSQKGKIAWILYPPPHKIPIFHIQ